MRLKQRTSVQVEMLEARDCPSVSPLGTPAYTGNVEAVFRNGSLVITGDNAGNGVRITAGPTANSFYVAGIDGTTINNQGSPQLFSNVRGLLSVNLKDGNDRLNFDGVSQTYMINSLLAVSMGAGDDVVQMTNVRTNGLLPATIDMGGGEDTFTAVDTTFSRGLALAMGSGNDNVSFTNCSLGGFSTISLGAGDDTLHAAQTTVARPVFMDNGGGTDTMDLNGLRLVGLFYRWGYLTP